MLTTQRTLETQQRFERLSQRSQHRAYRLAYSLTGNAADAEDITQDAYIRAWYHFERYDPNRSFESWVFRIILNRVIDLYRRKKRLEIETLDMTILGVDGQPLALEFTAPDSDPQDIFLGTIREERVQQALAALPEEYRQAFLLCAVEERSYQEIADTLHCAVGTVRSRVHRARVRLRRALESRAHVPLLT
jgi:RNA polymerase sigma-70 factor, ECF subfamily